MLGSTEADDSSVASSRGASFCVLLVGRELVLPFQLQFELGLFQCFLKFQILFDELGITFSFAIKLFVKVADSVPAGIGDQH